MEAWRQIDFKWGMGWEKEDNCDRRRNNKGCVMDGLCTGGSA
jgi:hypothetical protein